MNVDLLYPLVSEAIRRAETLEDLHAPGARAAYSDLSLLEERIAEALPADDPEGGVARRGAVRAAMAAEDFARARELVERFLGEVGGGGGLHDELEQLSRQLDRSAAAAERKGVLVLHGRTDASGSAVARFIERIGLQPIVLDESSDRVRFVMKMVDRSAGAVFAIVLLSPERLGDPSEGIAQPMSKTRLNVFFEFGLLVAHLGFHSVCGLYPEGMERPSSPAGVLLLPLDSEGAWQRTLEERVEQAGIERMDRIPWSRRKTPARASRLRRPGDAN